MDLIIYFVFEHAKTLGNYRKNYIFICIHPFLTLPHISMLVQLCHSFVLNLKWPSISSVIEYNFGTQHSQLLTIGTIFFFLPCLSLLTR